MNSITQFSKAALTESLLSKTFKVYLMWCYASSFPLL